MSSKYIKIKNFSKNTHLHCPDCNEGLLNVDIEMFNTCPYCDYNFPESTEMEDFILQPIVDEWIKFTSKNANIQKKSQLNL